jgi:phage virion morphogenesis protein
MGVTKTSAMSLPDLRQRMAAVASPAFRDKMARNLAEEARTQVSNGFQGQRDPYGKRWEPLSNPPKKRRGGMVLQDTGRMAASVSTAVTSFGFRIDIPVKYAAPHQYGAKAHTRKGGAIPQSRGGRFISRRKAATSKQKAQRVAIFGAFVHRGIPQRQMIPMNSTGGRGPIWTPAFRAVSQLVIDNHARGLS